MLMVAQRSRESLRVRRSWNPTFRKPRNVGHPAFGLPENCGQSPTGLGWGRYFRGIANT